VERRRAGSWKGRLAAILRLVALVLFVLLVQLTLIRRIRILGVGPDLALILVVYSALWAGAVGGTAAGFLVGLLQGLSSPVHFGSHALAKSIVGFGVGTLSPHVVRESLATQAAIIVGTQLVHDLIFLPLTMDTVGSAFVVLGAQTLPGAAYSAAVGCLIYRVFLKPIGMDLTSHGTSLL